MNTNVRQIKELAPQVSERTVATARQILEMAERGDITGFAFVALLRGGRYARGYTGEVVKQPEVTLGVLERIKADLLTQAGANSRVSSNK